MCASRYGKLGLKMISNQFTGWAMPSRITCPVGVCIQLFADRIQNAEMQVPNATTTQEVTCSQRGTRFQPNSITPRNVASRKKAVSTSYPIGGPMTLPTTSENRLQFVPNWYDIAMPDTTPMAKETANTLVQKRASTW